ncbi:hypothetical protein C3Z06_15575 [Cupriavidus metallidurans]|nr:hypothetical protein C3Z06_15575 [Cupriavidus metallidurans]
MRRCERQSASRLRLRPECMVAAPSGSDWDLDFLISPIENIHFDPGRHSVKIVHLDRPKGMRTRWDYAADESAACRLPPTVGPRAAAAARLPS